MKFSFALCILCASWLVAAQAAPSPALDVDTHGAGRRITRAERVLHRKREWRHDNKHDDNTFTGTGTFFTPSSEGGSTGACGDFNDDDAEIVALNGEQYGDSANESGWCGKKVEISVGNKKTTATITDMCPECKTGDLDMTKAVFEQLGDFDVGELDISWHVVS